MDFRVLRGSLDPRNRIGLFNNIPPEIMVRSMHDLKVREAIADSVSRRDVTIAQRVGSKKYLQEDIEEMARGAAKQDRIEKRLQKFEERALELAKWELDQEVAEEQCSPNKEIK